MPRQCHGPNSDGEDCGWIRWQKGSSKSPPGSMSPEGSQRSSLPPTNLRGVSVPPPTFQTVASQIKTTCVTQGCGQSRIAPDCTRRMCKKHCVAASGCPSKNHVCDTNGVAHLSLQPAPASNLTTFPMQPLPPSTPAIFPTPSLRDPAPSSSTYPIPLTNATADSIDAQPNPRYISHNLFVCITYKVVQYNSASFL